MTGEFGPAAEFYLQYKEASHLLEDVATYGTFTNSLRVGDRVERVRMGGGHELPVLDAGRAARARPPARGFR